MMGLMLNNRAALPTAPPPPPPLATGTLLTSNPELEELQRRAAEARQTDEAGDSNAGAIERRLRAPRQESGDPVLNRATPKDWMDRYLARGAYDVEPSGDPVLRRPQQRFRGSGKDQDHPVARPRYRET
jgi:hypothetical protein